MPNALPRLHKELIVCADMCMCQDPELHRQLAAGLSATAWYARYDNQKGMHACIMHASMCRHLCGACDGDVDAADEAGGVRGQKQDGPRNLFSSADLIQLVLTLGPVMQL